MNTQNYASLEASKRLHDAGIVLGTEAYWIRVANSPMMLVDNRHGADEYYPAPSMAEVWRELPEGIMVNGSWAPLFVNKIGCGASVGYRIEHHIIIHFSNENPTDALIDLLIFVRK